MISSSSSLSQLLFFNSDLKSSIGRRICLHGGIVRSVSNKFQLTIAATKEKTRAQKKFQVSCNSKEDDEGLTYKDAGVDIDAGAELVRRIAKMAPGIGGFGGLFPLGDSFLVAGTDGVGTKLKLAFETGIHDTIGIDLVAMSVNDIVTSGAKPLFFLDYFATSHLDVDLTEKVIKGIVDGCQQSDCTLLGGETAEMPDFYANGEYDLSGFAVGIVKKDSVIDGKNIVAGDVLIGLPSSGVHSNGFSLVRRVLAHSGLSLKDPLPGSADKPITLGEALMAPTIIYVKQVLDIISKGGVKGLAHITGGGFTDNIPRVFPKGIGAAIYKDSWQIPAIFKWIQEVGGITDAEMRRTFNMGIGMVLVVDPVASTRILAEVHGTTSPVCIGEVVSSEGVTYWQGVETFNPRPTRINLDHNMLSPAKVSGNELIYSIRIQPVPYEEGKELIYSVRPLPYEELEQGTGYGHGVCGFISVMLFEGPRPNIWWVEDLQ